MTPSILARIASRALAICSESARWRRGAGGGAWVTTGVVAAAAGGVDTTGGVGATAAGAGAATTGAAAGAGATGGAGGGLSMVLRMASRAFAIDSESAAPGGGGGGVGAATVLAAGAGGGAASAWGGEGSWLETPCIFWRMASRALVISAESAGAEAAGVLSNLAGWLGAGAATDVAAGAGAEGKESISLSFCWRASRAFRWASSSATPTEITQIAPQTTRKIFDICMYQLYAKALGDATGFRMVDGRGGSTRRTEFALARRSSDQPVVSRSGRRSTCRSSGR